MKALVFSDIHGSLPAARFIIAEIERQKPDAVFLLGDILYHGPRNPLPEAYDPRGVADILNNYAEFIVAVNGNCDSEVDAAILDFPIASSFSWIYADAMRIFLTHGHIHNPENLPRLRGGDILLYGHTHIPQAEIHDTIYFCNPGSISMPKEGHPKSFGVIENGGFSVVTIDGETYLHLTFC